MGTKKEANHIQAFPLPLRFSIQFSLFYFPFTVVFIINMFLQLTSPSNFCTPLALCQSFLVASKIALLASSKNIELEVFSSVRCTDIRTFRSDPLKIIFSLFSFVISIYFYIFLYISIYFYIFLYFQLVRAYQLCRALLPGVKTALPTPFTQQAYDNAQDTSTSSEEGEPSNWL